MRLIQGSLTRQSSGVALPTEFFPDALQLLVEQRVRAERAVGDLGDLLRLVPVALQLLDLHALVDGHFEGQAPFHTEAAQGELATGYVADELVGPAGALD